MNFFFFLETVQYILIRSIRICEYDRFPMKCIISVRQSCRRFGLFREITRYINHSGPGQRNGIMYINVYRYTKTYIFSASLTTRLFVEFISILRISFTFHFGKKILIVMFELQNEFVGLSTIAFLFLQLTFYRFSRIIWDFSSGFIFMLLSFFIPLLPIYNLTDRHFIKTTILMVRFQRRVKISIN